MSKIQILTALLLSYLAYTCAEETEIQKRIDNYLKPPPVFIKTAKAPSEEPSYFSKFTNWFQSLGGNKPKTKIIHAAIPGPGPQNISPLQQSLPPPIRHGPVTFQREENVEQTQSSHQYLPPHQYPAKDRDCNPCNREPWIPIVGNYGSKTVIGFVPPNQNKPSISYGPPVNNFNSKYVPSSNTHHNLPRPTNSYEPSNLGIASGQYGPPIKQQNPVFIPTPNPIIPDNYGPPLPSHFDNRPHRPRINLPPPPSAFMAPPPITSTKYGPPSTDFGNGPFDSYGPPPSGTGNVPPKITNNYEVPPSKPSNEYGTPSVPPGNYGPPTSYNIPPSLEQNNKYIPPNQNYDSPPFNIQDNSHSSSANLNQGVTDNYNVHSDKVKITSEEYLPPPQQLPLSSEKDNFHGLKPPPYVNYPIPFPNMSPVFILPIRNAQPFRTNQNYPSGTDNLSSSGGNVGEPNNVQITQSIPVAHFLSTIEYPPNIIQSPIIDLEVKDNLRDQNNNEGYQVNFKDNPIIVDGDEHHQEASDNHASITVHDSSSTKLSTNNPNAINTDNKQTAFATFAESFKNTSQVKNVQVEPTLETIFDDSNLAAIIAKQILTENTNNPPKPFELSENSKQNKVQVNQNAQATNNALFTQPTIDYSEWNPSVGKISMGMVPPAPSESSWRNNQNYIPHTTKKPKQIQIIVPYTTNKQGSDWYEKDLRQPPFNPSTSLLSNLPSAQNSQWLKYLDHNVDETKTKLIQSASPLVNIKDFFKDTNINVDHSNGKNLPFDILKFQKNIDGWTEQEFNKMKSDEVKSSTTTRFAYSKKIPEEYLTTQSIIEASIEPTSTSPNKRNSKFIQHDYTASSSIHHSIKAHPENLTNVEKLLEMNLIDSDETSTDVTAFSASSGISGKPSTTPATWDKIQVSISPLTNERVYVVTPLPWEKDASTPQSAWTYVPKNQIQQINKQLADNAKFVFNSPRFAVRPEPLQMNKSKDDVNSKIHLIYSDWPELINSLATKPENPQPATTSSLSTSHPLLGRMDISVHTPAPSHSQGVQTFVGHSKVVTAVTASNVAKKRNGIDEERSSTKAGELGKV